MKILSWNVRGLMAPDKRHLVKRAIDKMALDIVLFQETKLNYVKALDFMKFCFKWEGLFQAARGVADLWNPASTSVPPIASNANWLACMVSSIGGIAEFPLINVYGPTKTKEIGGRLLTK
ncbi:hypothetical protein SUGI_0678580 [Cryptomeria japonica]|nr:hypothetical protein SUGI_0678580 [Cryptomeria japonica]